MRGLECAERKHVLVVSSSWHTSVICSQNEKNTRHSQEHEEKGVAVISRVLVCV